jgi:ubiquinone biosynthesis protein
LPRLVHQALTHVTDRPSQEQNDLMRRLLDEQRRTNALLAISLSIVACLLAGYAVARFLPNWHFHPF